MPIAIRPATAGDIDTLLAIEQRAFSGDRLSRRSLRRLVGRGTADVLVALSGDTANGYSMILYRSNARAARLYSIAVATDAEKGVGRALLSAAEEQAARRGAGAMRLEVREDNRRAIDLYERNGYRRIGRRDGYYADGATALRYEKQLDAPGASQLPEGRAS